MKDKILSKHWKTTMLNTLTSYLKSLHIFYLKIESNLINIMPNLHALQKHTSSKQFVFKKYCLKYMHYMIGILNGSRKQNLIYLQIKSLNFIIHTWIFISAFGVGTFALYFILNTLGFSYTLLVMTAFVLALMIIYKEKNKLILSNIILLGISIILQLAFIFSRDYVLSFFTSTITAASGILTSIVIAILYKNNFHENESKKCKISSSTVSKITTIVIAIICIICTVILHTFAINAMYYSSLPVGFAKEYKDVSYGPYGIRNTMTIYVPKSALAREENAAMIYLHPGGWNAGDKNLCSSDARRAAKQGYITMFMNYRF